MTDLTYTTREETNLVEVLPDSDKPETLEAAQARIAELEKENLELLDEKAALEADYTNECADHNFTALARDKIERFLVQMAEIWSADFGGLNVAEELDNETERPLLEAILTAQARIEAGDRRRRALNALAENDAPEIAAIEHAK